MDTGDIGDGHSSSLAQVSEPQLHNLVECPSDILETNTLIILQSESREFPNSLLTSEILGQESVVGFPAIVTYRPTACTDVSRPIGRAGGTEATPWEEEVGYDVRYLVKNREGHGGRREYLARWEDQNSNDLWLRDEGLSDSLLWHWWTRTKGDLRSGVMDVSIFDSEARVYNRTWDEVCGVNIDIDQFGNEL